jgi:4-diphosphocytidyl-2-C-methyl-D-erythritol kinase
VRVQYNRTNGAKIRLEKNIPIAAGLAGGSADAAATLVAANFLMGLNLNKEQLAHIGLGIGSDLPFFFSTGQAIVTGRGEVVTPTKFPTDYSLILVTPNLTISTAEAYGSLRIDLTKPKEPFSLSRCSTVMDLVVQIGRSVNDFEDAHFLSYPALGKIKNGLLQIGASLVRMSGSGPTLFGLFYHPPDLKKRIPNIEDDWIVNTAKPVISI